MARPSKHDGVVYRRNDGKIWWMRYRDASGTRRLESTNTEDWEEAHRRMRERLQARDNRTLEVVRKGEQLSFKEWTDSFMENYSKPPIRAAKTHEANQRAMMHLQATFGLWRLVDVTADDIEQYLRTRLKKHARVKRRTAFESCDFSRPLQCIRSSGFCVER